MSFVSERFEAKVQMGDPWDCWEWQGYRNQDGYGRFGIGQRRTAGAHRLAFEWSRGRPVREGLEVMHACDNPPCVNPCHLVEGTHKENMHDSIRKGRLKPPPQTPEAQAVQRENTPKGDDHWMRRLGSPYLGEKNGNSKLTQAKVDEMRRLREQEGLTLVELGKRFGVNHTMAGFIVRYEVWADGSKEKRQNRPPRGERAPKAALTMPQKAHRGENAGNVKLTWEKVREMRRLYSLGGYTQDQLATRYQVHQTVVSAIIRNRTWREEDEPPPVR